MRHRPSTANIPSRHSRSKVTCPVVGLAADLVEVDCRKMQCLVPWCKQDTVCRELCKTLTLSQVAPVRSFRQAMMLVKAAMMRLQSRCWAQRLWQTAQIDMGR